jgi:DNA repair protein RadD
MRRERELGEAAGDLAKECPMCATLVGLGARVCPACGYMWPELPKHDALADDAAILSDERPEWLPVSAMGFYRHQKKGSPDSLRVEYRCGLAVHRQWICFEHAGYAREKAKAWWRARGAHLPPPDTVTEALERRREVSRPDEICVRRQGKYFEVIGHRIGIRPPPPRV